MRLFIIYSLLFFGSSLVQSDSISPFAPGTVIETRFVAATNQMNGKVMVTARLGADKKTLVFLSIKIKDKIIEVPQIEFRPFIEPRLEDMFILYKRNKIQIILPYGYDPDGINNTEDMVIFYFGDGLFIKAEVLPQLTHDCTCEE